MANTANQVRQFNQAGIIPQNNEPRAGGLHLGDLFPVTIPAHIAIVILNWNGAHHLRRFLPGVLKTDYPSLEIVVADNGSTDNSLELLKQDFPTVRIIELGRNYGFAEGYNRALEQVEADYFMILNSDVEVTPEWLLPMAALLESDPKIAACQPKILSLQQPETFDYAGAAGGWLDAFGYPFARGRIFDHCEIDEGQYNDATPIFWASGAALFIRASVFRELGGFDPYFFAHQEEIDLCWRIQRKGHRIFACPSSVVHHLGGGTLPRGNSLKTYLNFRNNHLMLFKNLSFGRKCWIIPVRFALDGLSAWKGLLAGDPGYFISIAKAHWGVFVWILSRGYKFIFSGSRVKGLDGWTNKNMIWQHFVRGQNRFSQIFPASSKK